MKRIVLAVLALPLAALAGGVSTTTALLNRVPAVPHDAAAAYAQWVDKNGDLTPGPAYGGLEADIKATEMAPLTQQSAAMNSIMQKYATPQGQAELQHMTMAQKMEVARQMQAAQMGGQMTGAVVSDNDGALLRKLQPNAGTIQIRQKMADIAVRLGAIEQQWSAEDAKLAQARDTAMSKLAICKSEAGEPSELAIKGVMLDHAGKRIALAASELPKYQALATEKRGLVAQETRYADEAWSAYQHLQSPTLKSQMHSLVTGTVANTAADVAAVLGVVETGSKRAAETVARKKSLEAQYKDAKGC
ncbi:MAG TPA: hypothetical protein VGF56_07500 [Rhizomicrobium sp.]|jgi:hypothetical protein